jgi:hypothetical protein
VICHRYDLGRLGKCSVMVGDLGGCEVVQVDCDEGK